MKYSLNILNYNYVPESLIKHLWQKKSKTDWTINIWDDGSTKSNILQLKSLLKNISHINFFTQEENIGRSAMRNKILENSKAEWTVCMDSDLAPSSNFISLLHAQLTDNSSLYKGVHNYSNSRPTSEHILHWKYGKIRETHPANSANKHPYRYFNTSLFAVHKSLLPHVKFDTKIQKYGHEDTVLSSRLKKANITIKYIDLPLIHEGLKPTNQFLTQQLLAVENLIDLTYQGYDLYSPLLKWGRRVKHIPLAPFVLKSNKMEHFLKNRLSSDNPRLVWLDLLKLRKYLIYSKK